MQTNFQHIKKQFEKSLADYDQNASVQNLMAAKMTFELVKISTSFENILELGSGTGLLTKKIAKEIKFQKYYANDIVEKSKLYIEKIIPNLNFIHGNAAKIKIERKADLIISNAMFQWFENIEKFIEITKQKMTKNGILAFSTFSPDNFKEIKEITGLSLKYKTKDELAHILNNQGFEILYSEEFYETIEFNNPLELLTHLKKTGVNSLADKIWTIKEVKNFCDKFSRKNPKTILTYAPIIIIAKLK